MLAALTALSAAMTSACTPVPSADRLWQREVRWVIVGEMHGTNETPAAFVNLACLAATTNRPVTVALEIPKDEQPALDAYMNSNGSAAARQALLRLPRWQSRIQYGRTSAAYLLMLDGLRKLKQSGKIKGVVAADVPSTFRGDTPRDAAMAGLWMEIPAADDGIILILAGNFHAIRKTVTTADRTILPAGSLMPRGRSVTLTVFGNGGTAWTCQAQDCGMHPNGSPHQGTAGITYSQDDQQRWDGVYELGVPTTASLPAVDPADSRPSPP